MLTMGLFVPNRWFVLGDPANRSTQNYGCGLLRWWQRSWECASHHSKNCADNTVSCDGRIGSCPKPPLVNKACLTPPAQQFHKEIVHRGVW
jgi:hypothetical protein